MSVPCARLLFRRHASLGCLRALLVSHRNLGKGEISTPRSRTFSTAEKHAAWSMRPAQETGDDSRKLTTWHPVQIAFKGLNFETSPILLRDLCTCPKCVDPSTRQKLFSTTDIPTWIRVKSQVENGDSLEFTWKKDIPHWGEDHVTTIPWSVLEGIGRRGCPVADFRLPKKILWSAQTYGEQAGRGTRYDAYMNDDRVLRKVVRDLYQYGLVFIHEVPESEDAVSQIAERIGPLKNTFYGQTWDVRSVPQATNVAYTSQNLDFHMDLLYMEQPPHIQLLHCIRSSAAGGASLFTDSFNTVVHLAKTDISAFKVLSHSRVDFHYDHPGSHYYHQSRAVIESSRVPMGERKLYLYQAMNEWNLGVNVRDAMKFIAPSQDESAADSFRIEDYIDAVSWSPPFQAPFFANSREANVAARHDLGTRVETWHRHAKKFDRMIHNPKGIYERLMKPGECVLFDNRRVLHARRAFEVGDEGKERWLRGAYIDKDPFMSKLRILEKKFAQESDELPDEAFVKMDGEI